MAGSEQELGEVLTTQPTRRTKRMLSFAFVVVLLIVIGALDAEVGDQHSSVQQRRRMGMSIFISFIDFERDNPIIVSTFSLSIFVAIYWNMRAQGLQNIVFAASSSMLIIFVLLFLPNILNHPRGVAPTSQSIGRSITLNQSKYVDAGTDEQKIEQPRLVVEWVKPASNSSHPHSRVVVAQTCGHGAYLPLLAETRRVNERYALGQGFAYLIVTGLYHGNTEWHSTFNKAFILRAVLMDETQYEILFYMDADAMVINPSFPLLGSFPLDYRGRQIQEFLLAAHGSSPRHPLNFNAGVLVWNLRHPLVYNASSLWVKESVGSMRSRGHDDQSLLWGILRRMLSNEQQWTILPELQNYDPITRRKNIAHILRSTGAGDWSGKTVAARVKSAKQIASEIEWTS